ncbi:solute carrier family [Anaeramoeba flamelloides]|uniref:Solute carrier family n=1 Tax=Anaeramoeba flamelloides TaxID=1746091 RepID=A0AAV7YJ54_9EUKA|nr:solute carrier family [Anaeramoeba flamelloides]
MENQNFFVVAILISIIFFILGTLGIYYFILHVNHSRSITYQKLYFVSVSLFCYTSTATFLIDLTNTKLTKELISNIHFFLEYFTKDPSGAFVQQKKKLLRVAMFIYVLVTMILFFIFSKFSTTTTFRVLEATSFIFPVLLSFYYSWRINRKINKTRQSKFTRDFKKMYKVIAICALLQCLSLPFFIGYYIWIKSLSDFGKSSIFFCFHLLDIITFILLIVYVFQTPKKINSNSQKQPSEKTRLNDDINESNSESMSSFL